MNISLERRKLEVLLTMQGNNFRFVRYVKNRYNEETDNIEEENNIIGIYHEVRDRIEKIEGNITKYYSVTKPMILGRFTDIQSVIKVGDILLYGNQTLEVTGVTNVNKVNIYSDISLKVIDSE